MQPICLYDFTLRTLTHDLLNYSTRHITEHGKHSYVNSSFFSRQSTSQLSAFEMQRRSTMITKGTPMHDDSNTVSLDKSATHFGS